MTKLIIEPSMHLTGEINISGAKNATLPIICAGILTSDTIHLSNIPNLRDIDTLLQILSSLGIDINYQPSIHTLDISTNCLTNITAHYDLVKQMRASILVLGPMLARFKEAIVSLPGGCAIGSRPVDIHLKGLEQMGANINIQNGYIHATAVNGLHGAIIAMNMVTVTGTENLLMAASLANGVTVLKNCAIEPEVTDLANCLVKMGANIIGIGTNELIITGVTKLHGASHAIISDRIEAGTYAVASAITMGDITLNAVNIDIMQATIMCLKQCGAVIKEYDAAKQIRIIMQKKPIGINIETAVYPGFATDMQAQFMALNSIATGQSHIKETIFENRFMHVAELCRMGANITINDNDAIINGVSDLHGANVMATDLRASASLVLAGLVATGNTTLERVYHLDRGYETMEIKLNQVGANIKRIKT